MHKPMRLSLPGFTFGLDVLLLAGTLRLSEHRTLDVRPSGSVRPLGKARRLDFAARSGLFDRNLYRKARVLAAR
jgi:hypothetical protein